MPRYSTAGRLDLQPRPRHLAEVRPARCPLLDDKVVPDVLAPRLESQIGEDREDPAERVADRLFPDVEIAGRVILEDRVLGVEREDRVDVVLVPGLVVDVDELLERCAIQSGG
jgi:hypothetical protein